jgi:hypothetical protein
MDNINVSTIAAEELLDIIASNSYNKWIFRKSDPKEKRDYTYCYGPSGYCPHQLMNVNDSKIIKRVGIIPYFRWLGDSWLLLGIINDQNMQTVTDFGTYKKIDHNKKPISYAFASYYKQTCGLMDNKLMIGPQSLIGNAEDESVTLFVEYKEFPANIVQKFKNSEFHKGYIDQLAIVQYSYLLSNWQDLRVSPTIDAIIDFLPLTL